eukprot:3007366-Pleurochrysis_carterae.AAC.1
MIRSPSATSLRWIASSISAWNRARFLRRAGESESLGGWLSSYESLSDPSQCGSQSGCSRMASYAASSESTSS